MLITMETKIYAYLTVKHCGIVQLVEFSCQFLFVLLKTVYIAGARVCERLQEATWSLTQHNSRRNKRQKAVIGIKYS